MVIYGFPLPKTIHWDNFYHRQRSIAATAQSPARSTATQYFSLHRYPPIWPLKYAALHHYAQISVLSPFFIYVSTIKRSVCDRNPINNLCVVVRYEFSLFAAAGTICHPAWTITWGVGSQGGSICKIYTHTDWAANFSHSRLATPVHSLTTDVLISLSFTFFLIPAHSSRRSLLFQS